MAAGTQNMWRGRDRKRRGYIRRGSRTITGNEAMTQPTTSTPAPMSSRTAVRAISVGAIALGATAIGAIAIGAMAIGRLRILEARIEKLSIGTLTVDHLHVRSEK